MEQGASQPGTDLLCSSYDVEDISNGLEPVRIPALLLARETLARFEKYTTDSVLPDGTPLSQVPLESRGNALDDHSEAEDQEEAGCECQPPTGGDLTCTRKDGDSCDCVGAYGNFYQDMAGTHATLNLDALPDNWPLVECSPDCPCADSCANRLTQRGVQAPLAVRPVPHAGLGLFYSPIIPTKLPKGSFISLYAGEYLTTAQVRQRWSEQTANAQPGEGNYILSLRLPNLTLHIDPRRTGNVGRFLNHSCDPNCVIQVVRWGTGSWPRAAIFTKRDVDPGEELVFDYGDAAGSGGAVAEGEAEAVLGLGRTKCFCGSANCRGWMPFDRSL